MHSALAHTMDDCKQPHIPEHITLTLTGVRLPQPRTTDEEGGEWRE